MAQQVNLGGPPVLQGVQPPQAPFPGANLQTIARLVQSNSTPPPQLQQAQQGGQAAPIGQLHGTPLARGNDFSGRKNQWPLSRVPGAQRVKDFFQKKFTSDGALKLGTNTVNSGMGKGNVDSQSGELSKISGSYGQQTGVDAGGEAIGIMNLAGEVLAYQALQEQDQAARAKIQTYQQAKVNFDTCTRQEATAQQDLANANQALNTKQARLLQLQGVQGGQGVQAVQGEIDVKDARLQGMQQSLQTLNNANLQLQNAQAQLTTAQQLPQAQQPNPQQMQLLQDAVTNANTAVLQLRARDPNLDLAQHPNLQQEITDLGGELAQLRQEEQTLTADIQTLNDQNVNTPGSIAKFTADHLQSVANLGLAKGAMEKLEATAALGKATKVDTARKAYQIGQLTQKSGVVAATGVKIGSDSLGVIQGTLTGAAYTFAQSAGVVSTGVSALSLPLDCYSLHQDRLAIQGAKSTLKKVELAENNNVLQLDGTEKAFMKMMKRKLPIADKQFSAAYNSTKIIAGLGGATAVGFKIAVLAGVTAGAVTAGAACLTPIGWALAGVAAATLIGYGIFKLSRFIHSKRQQKAYLETATSLTPLNTHKGQKILGKMADDYISVHPNPPQGMTRDAYRTQVIQTLSADPGITGKVQEMAEQGLISRSRGYGIEIMTDRLRQEPKPDPAQNIPPGRTYQLLTALGVKPEDLDKIIDSNNIGDAQKLLGKRLRVS